MGGQLRVLMDTVRMDMVIEVQVDKGNSLGC